MGELPNDARVECGKHNTQTLTVQPSVLEMCYLCVIHFDDFLVFKYSHALIRTSCVISMIKPRRAQA